MAADDFCYLTTTGRRSGRPHEIEIWYARAGETLFVLAGGGRTSDWVRNAETNPRVTVRFADEELPAIVRILDHPRDAAEADRARTLVFEKYQPRYEGDLLEWRDRSLPIAVDLIAD
jgi:deazaflavin-dependent oxidoreductase (nitroreductase family)